MRQIPSRSKVPVQYDSGYTRSSSVLSRALSQAWRFLLPTLITKNLRFEFAETHGYACHSFFLADNQLGPAAIVSGLRSQERRGLGRLSK